MSDVFNFCCIAHYLLHLLHSYRCDLTLLVHFFTRRLYQEASARKSKAIDKSLLSPPDCSFEPSISRSQSWASPKRGDKTRTDTPTRLYNSTREKIERREALTKKGEDAALAKCTFKPSISKRPSSAPRMRPSTDKPKENIALKLYKDASVREKRMQIETEKIASQIKMESNVAVSINKINSPTSPTITSNNSNTHSTLINFDDSTNTAKKIYPVSGSFEDRMKSSDERVSEKIKKKRVS